MRVSEIFHTKKKLVDKELFSTDSSRLQTDKIDKLIRGLKMSRRSNAQIVKTVTFAHGEEARNYVVKQLQTSLTEEVWKLPTTADDLTRLKALLDKPLVAKDAFSALYDILGTSLLSSQLQSLADEDPNALANDLVSSYIELEYPSIAQKFKSSTCKRDCDGTLATLGHKDEM